MSFIAQRPAYEPGFKIIRQEVGGRSMVYTLECYSSASKPESERY